MSSKRRKKFKHKQKSSKTSIAYLLEQGSLRDMRRNKNFINILLKYHWNLYQDLAYQRKLIESDLIRVLNEDCIHNHSFDNWQRTVKYKYSNHPLSTLGSLIPPGGRFNIGDINQTSFMPFPGLYIAQDKDTALQETLSPKSVTKGRVLTELELALTDPKSIAIVSVSGFLERVFDLRNDTYLKKFAELIKNFRISPAIIELAKKCNERPKTVKTKKELFKSLMEDNWRLFPMQYDIPANSQIFGQLVHAAKVDGILYCSCETGKDCLVIYPRNFEYSTSYIQLDHEPPYEKTPQRLDKTCWKLSEISLSEI